MINRELFDFIRESPTAFHAVNNIAETLVKAGYSELSEREGFEVERGGSYFVRRNDSSLIALRLPENGVKSFNIMAAHSDAPSFKLKEQPERKNDMYSRLAVEKYGGMLCASWLDRTLSAAGRVLLREGDRLRSVLVDLKDELFMIPNVAIHMDRSANEGKAYNANVDMLPLMGSAAAAEGYKSLLAKAAGCEYENIVSAEMFLYPCEKGRVWGVSKEYISSPRLDDLQCAFGCMKGFVGAESRGEVCPVLCVFDNEEVGSGTKQGADSDFLDSVLLRVCEALGMSMGEYKAALSNSFMVSADNAHAVHPNHPEYADANDRPAMNGGVVIKYNANQRYTTDAVSAAVFSEICRRAGVPTQRFSNRADLAGGSTLGNISSAHVSVDSVDIGLAQLAMHSAVETAGAKDTELLIKAAKAFYETDVRALLG